MPSSTSELRSGTATSGRAATPFAVIASSRGPWASRSRFAAAPGPAPTLALIGGQRLLRDATAELLGAQSGLNRVGSFESATHFISDRADSRPVVLLLDCDDEEIAAVREAVGLLRGAAGDCKVAMLASEVSDELVRCTIDHQLSGFILKSCTTREVRSAIAYIATGRTVMPANWQRAVGRPTRDPLRLSPRHREILALIAAGRCTEEIAALLELSPNTVKFHIRELYSRLGVRNRVEAANQYGQLHGGAC